MISADYYLAFYEKGILYLTENKPHDALNCFHIAASKGCCYAYLKLATIYQNNIHEKDHINEAMICYERAYECLKKNISEHRIYSCEYSTVRKYIYEFYLNFRHKGLALSPEEIDKRIAFYKD